MIVNSIFARSKKEFFLEKINKKYLYESWDSRITKRRKIDFI